jgi:hypothetical protein
LEIKENQAKEELFEYCIGNLTKESIDLEKAWYWKSLNKESLVQIFHHLLDEAKVKVGELEALKKEIFWKKSWSEPKLEEESFELINSEKKEQDYLTERGKVILEEIFLLEFSAATVQVLWCSNSVLRCFQGY